VSKESIGYNSTFLIGKVTSIIASTNSAYSSVAKSPFSYLFSYSIGSPIILGGVAINLGGR